MNPAPEQFKEEEIIYNRIMIAFFMNDITALWRVPISNNWTYCYNGSTTTTTCWSKRIPDMLKHTWLGP
jgi:hypothetical protein